MTQKDFEAFHLRIQKMHHGRYFVHFLKINAKHTTKDIYLASQKLDCDLFTDDSYRNIKARFDDPNYDKRKEVENRICDYFSDSFL